MQRRHGNEERKEFALEGSTLFLLLQRNLTGGHMVKRIQKAEFVASASG